MAKFVGKIGTTGMVDTLCEHMGGKKLSPNADVKEVLLQANLRGLAHIYDFCPICGQKLHEYNQPLRYTVCSECEEPVCEIGGVWPLFCPFCGVKFDGSEEVEEVKK